MATISINNMRFYAHHGCFEEERRIGTHFKVDLRLVTDTSRAELSDDIADTVNYLEVYRVVKAEMEKPSHLLEHVARRVGDSVLRDFPAVQQVVVAVHKLNPPLGGQMDSVCVEIEMKR
ncbi:MAG: dihydroneopterin aldolase [Bacteroidales bacterium]|nr:dihydroneopterin aldolase [Bacteroidales bacterium]